MAKPSCREPMMTTAARKVSGLGQIATRAMAAMMVAQACATMSAPRQVDRSRTSTNCCSVNN
jgi:hypothetical protein